MPTKNASQTSAARAMRPPPDPSLTGADLVRAAEELVPLLRERAAEADANRGISPDTYRRLEDAGFVHMLMPRKYGGLELDNHAVAMATMTLGRGCASTAWIATIMSVGSTLVLHFPQEVHDEVWTEDPYAMMAGGAFLNPNAKAERVKGGYRLSGSWYFGSGSDFARWLIFNAPVAEKGGEPHMFLVRQDEVQLLDDWNVTGLRGTNSQTQVVEDVFVPDRRVRPTIEYFSRGAEEARDRYPTFDALWSPFPSPGRFPFATAGLGAALGAADWFAESFSSLTRSASPLGGVLNLADQQYMSIEFAEAFGELEWARTILDLRSRESAELAAAHQLPTPEWRNRVSLDGALMVRVALRSVQRLFPIIGTKACDPSHPLNIAKRDVEMVAIRGSWHLGAASYTSAALLGKPPGMTY